MCARLGRRSKGNGVEIIEIPAAYTSIVGKLKYMDMYSIPIHNAAAIVIGRLGMEIKDKVVTNIFKDKDFVTLEGRTQSVTLKKKSFLWFKSKFKIYQKSSALTAPCLAPANNGHKTLASSTGEEIIESNNWSDSSQGKLIF